MVLCPGAGKEGVMLGCGGGGEGVERLTTQAFLRAAGEGCLSESPGSAADLGGWDVPGTSCI